MDISADLPALIRQHLASVWALEILLHLRKEPDRLWSIDELVAALRATTTLVSNNLKILETSGLAVMEEGRYRYAPASQLLRTFADEVEAMYRERPVTVINLISAPPDRLQALADAFKFRGDR
jgi:predicted transcriptional regulator